MKTILFIIQKEFIQVFRNRMMLPMILFVPLVQMLILIYAATMEMKHIDLFVVDQDQTEISRDLINKFKGSPFFTVNGFSFSIKEAEDHLKKDRTDVVLYIPRNFSKNLYRQQKGNLQLLINAINGMKAGLINAYAQNVIAGYSQNIMVDITGNQMFPKPAGFDIRYRFWFNSQLNFKYYMLPGILVILVTIMGMILSAVSMVREKELGTIEQINVTPIRKYEFLAGKLMPFWIIALFELGFGLLIGKLLFHIPIRGSLFLLFGFSSIYLLVVMGIGLFFSTITQTQQQIMLLFFFFNIVFILMSGLFTPVESMPRWAQIADYINPLAYFMRVIRMIMLKGSGLKDVLQEIIILSGYAVIILSLSVWRYRKTG